METIEYSDTADGLSRMSKEQFRATYLKLESEAEKRTNKSSSCFYIGLGTVSLCLIPLLVTTTMPYTTLYLTLAITLFVASWVFLICMMVVSYNKEFRAKDDLEILERAAPEEVRRIQAERSHLAYNNSKHRFLAESTELANRLGI